MFSDIRLTFSRISNAFAEVLGDSPNSSQAAANADKPQPPITFRLHDDESPQGDLHTVQIEALASGAPSAGNDVHERLAFAVQATLGAIMPELRPKVATQPAGPGVVGTITIQGTRSQVAACRRIIDALSSLALLAAQMGTADGAALRLLDLLRDPSATRCLADGLITITGHEDPTLGHEGAQVPAWHCKEKLHVEEALQLIDMASALFADLDPRELGAHWGASLVRGALSGEQSHEVKSLLVHRLIGAWRGSQPGSPEHLDLFKAVGQTLCRLLSESAIGPHAKDEWEPMLDEHIQAFLSSGEVELLGIAKQMLSTKFSLKGGEIQFCHEPAKLAFDPDYEREEGIIARLDCDEQAAQYAVALYELCTLELRDDPAALDISHQLSLTAAWLLDTLAQFHGKVATRALKECTDMIVSRARTYGVDNERRLLALAGFKLQFEIQLDPESTVRRLVLVPTDGCVFDPKSHAQLLIAYANALGSDPAMQGQCGAVMRYLAEREDLLDPSQRQRVLEWTTRSLANSDEYLDVWHSLFKAEQSRWDVGLRSPAIEQLALACRILAARDPHKAQDLLELFPEDVNYRPLYLATYLHVLRNRPAALLEAWPGMTTDAYDALETADKVATSQDGSGAALHADGPPATGSLAHSALLWQELCKTMVFLRHRGKELDIPTLACASRFLGGKFMDNLTHADPAARSRLLIALLHDLQDQPAEAIPALLLAEMPAEWAQTPPPGWLMFFGPNLPTWPDQLDTVAQCCRLLCACVSSGQALAEPVVIALLRHLVDTCFLHDTGRRLAIVTVSQLVANAGSIVICMGEQDVAGSRLCKRLIRVASNMHRITPYVSDEYLFTSSAVFALKANSTAPDGLRPVIRSWKLLMWQVSFLCSSLLHQLLLPRSRVNDSNSSLNRVGIYGAAAQSEILSSVKLWGMEGTDCPGMIYAVDHLCSAILSATRFQAIDVRRVSISSGDFRPIATSLNSILKALRSPFFLDGTRKDDSLAKQHLHLAEVLSGKLKQFLHG